MDKIYNENLKETYEFLNKLVEEQNVLYSKYKQFLEKLYLDEIGSDKKSLTLQKRLELSNIMLYLKDSLQNVYVEGITKLNKLDKL